MFTTDDEKAIRSLAATIGTKTPSQAQLATLSSVAGTQSFSGFCDALADFAKRGKFTGEPEDVEKNETLREQFEALGRRFYSDAENAPHAAILLKQNRAKRATALRYVSRLRGWKSDTIEHQPPQNVSHTDTFTPDDERVLREVAQALGNPRNRAPSQAVLGNLTTLAATGSLADLCLELDALANQGKFTGDEREKRKNGAIARRVAELLFRFSDETADAERAAQNRAKRARALRYITRLRGWRPADNPPPVQNAGHSKLFSSGDETAIRDLAAQIGHPRQTPSQSLLGNLITLASVASMAELRLEIDALANQGKFTGRAFQRHENAAIGRQFSALMRRFYHPDEDAAPNDETVTHNRAKRANALRYLTQLRGLAPQRRGNPKKRRQQGRRKHGSRNRKRKR